MTPEHEVVIVGAGFGGMGAAIAFKRLGIDDLLILERVTRKLGDSVFYIGNCATSRSYYFNQHGEAAILRPTSTMNAMREANRFPLDAYHYA